jgi:hypothetical protein
MEDQTLMIIACWVFLLLQNERGITPLGVAVGFNRTELVQLLLDSGADLAMVDGQGNTVLHYAAGYGRKEVAELLLMSGADMDATNKAGQKPQDVAKVNGEVSGVDQGLTSTGEGGGKVTRKQFKRDNRDGAGERATCLQTIRENGVDVGMHFLLV